MQSWRQLGKWSLSAYRDNATSLTALFPPYFFSLCQTLSNWQYWRYKLCTLWYILLAGIRVAIDKDQVQRTITRVLQSITMQDTKKLQEFMELVGRLKVRLILSSQIIEIHFCMTDIFHNDFVTSAVHNKKNWRYKITPSLPLCQLFENFHGNLMDFERKRDRKICMFHCQRNRCSRTTRRAYVSHVVICQVSLSLPRV